MTQLQQLLIKSRELFIKYGVKSLTMDEIARELGMSKKTIYLHVENKADLVMKVVNLYLQDERTEMDQILKNSKNSIDEMVQMIHYLLTNFSELNTSAIYDLQKYYPKAWNTFNEYRNNYVLERIKDNLKKGIEQDVYRNDMDAEIIGKIYVAGIDMMLNEQLFPSKRYQFLDVYKQFVNYHLRGIVSPKGLKFLEQNNLFTQA
jgi:AcrR family transcriptional regulator